MKAGACFAALLLVGCGPTSGGGGNGSSSGSSGIPGTKRLSELTVEEATNLCLELADDFPERLVSCSSGESFSAGYQEGECSAEQPAPDTCLATVGNLRSCAESFYNMPDAVLCASDSLPPECDPLENCPI